MYWKFPENTDKYFWTEHAKTKMKHYGLTAQRIKRVLKSPLRREEGIAEKTIAVMQPQSTRQGENGEKDWKNEIWVMYQIKNKKSEKNFDKIKNNNKLAKILNNFENNQIKIISAWRYPGKTKIGEDLPESIWNEIEECEI